MGKRNGLRLESTALPVLLALLIFASGCTLSPAYWMRRADKYYLIDIPECRLSSKDKDEKLIRHTDERIVQCSGQVKAILRERFNNARLARTGGGAIQVLTAAVSSMLTGISGANALTAATILSGTSAIVPELSSVIEAKDRAEVYSEGLKAIEGAEAVFLKAVVAKSGGKIDGDKMTTDGAQLYDTLVAAVHVVEARLASLLPSVEELQRLRAAAEAIEVAPNTISLRPLSPEEEEAEKAAAKKADTKEEEAREAAQKADDAKDLADKARTTEKRATRAAKDAAKKDADDKKAKEEEAEKAKAAKKTVAEEARTLHKEAVKKKNAAKELAAAEGVGTARVQITRGGPAGTASSDNISVASVKLLPGDMVAEIHPGQVEYGRATITLTNSRGGRGTVTVIVEKEPFEIDRAEVHVQEGKPPAPVTVLRGGYIKEMRWVEPAADIAEAEVIVTPPEKDKKGKTEVKITGKKVEKDSKTTLELENGSGRKLRIDVTVTAKPPPPPAPPG